MDENMNHTQNNPRPPFNYPNLPAPVMPFAESKAPVMPFAESKKPNIRPYMNPTAQMPSGMQPAETDQPMQFGSPSMQSMPASPRFGMASQTAMPPSSVSGMQQGPPPVTSIQYIPGYLASIIGRTVRAEFIIGDNSFVDRTGVLTDVGVNYFVLHDVTSRQYIMCDLYSVRFVTILN